MGEKSRFRIALPTVSSRGGRAHRLFHPLCGATLPVLLSALRAGDLAPRRTHVAGIAVAMAALRLPFTTAEALYSRARVPRPGHYPAPVFIVGHWRSGTTHLANLLSRSDAFGILSPMSVGLPAEALGLARIARPFIDQFFPANRLIDDMVLRADLPQEDELAMANLSTLSLLHGIYFPRRLRSEFDRSLFNVGVAPSEQERWAHVLERYVAKMTAAAGGRPLLIRNPASSTRIDQLLRIWPGARFIHIHRHPASVYGSSIRMFSTLIRELALGRAAHEGTVRHLVRHVYPRLMGALARAATAHPSGSFMSLPHAFLEADPGAALEEMRTVLGLPLAASDRAGMVCYARGHPRTPRSYPLDDSDAAFMREHRALFASFGYDAADAASS